MSPKKLSDTDKRNIIELYRQPEETTSTLASLYGVSNSTISRFLKTNLSEQEYEGLIQQKRSTRTHNNVSTLVENDIEDHQDPESENKQLPSSKPVEIRRRRSTSSTPSKSEIEETLVIAQKTEPALPIMEIPTTVKIIDSELLEDNYTEKVGFLEDMLGEELEDEDDEGDDLEDSNEEDWDDDASYNQMQGRIFPIQSRTNVQVLPLSAAYIPQICYLVVDRSAELIARPLKEFGDLGRIPAEEVLQKTLPIFDNHRIARRFSNRTQRVIKIPDGKMIQKTCSHLQAKGITRLLIDGQVYSLLP